MLRARAAFTFIEILGIVLATAVLVSLLLPLLGRARESTRRAACMGNQWEISRGLLEVAQDQGRFPAVIDPDLWRQRLQPVLSGTRVWHCPGNLQRGSGDYGFNAALSDLDVKLVAEPAAALLLADAREPLISARGSIVMNRHDRSCVASFVDGHQASLTASAPLIFNNGEAGSLLVFGAGGTPILFAGSTRAAGRDVNLRDGQAVLLVNRSAQRITPRIKTRGGLSAPTTGLTPALQEMVIEPGQTRAFSLFCWLQATPDDKVETSYIFGEAPTAVTITVQPLDPPHARP